MCLQYKAFENTAGKEKLLVMSNFSISHSVFYLFRELSAIFMKFEIVVCKLFQFGTCQNFVIWERVNNLSLSRPLSSYIFISCWTLFRVFYLLYFLTCSSTTGHYLWVLRAIFCYIFKTVCYYSGLSRAIFRNVSPLGMPEIPKGLLVAELLSSLLITGWQNGSLVTMLTA